MVSVYAVRNLNLYGFYGKRPSAMGESGSSVESDRSRLLTTHGGSMSSWSNSAQPQRGQRDKRDLLNHFAVQTLHALYTFVGPESLFFMNTPLIAQASGSPSAGRPAPLPIGRRLLASLVWASDGRLGPAPQASSASCLQS